MPDEEKVEMLEMIATLEDALVATEGWVASVAVAALRNNALNALDEFYKKHNI
jgi:hypothetical protein